ncbi:predicted protein [Thalassiosira pseudonana CCMP1335]|uniref:peptidylprolyl isomerase n=1 Tax=Thalassiosira pseudonana TaxID=35128 RepID=B8BVK9_THAPS|nr:predicted protein [Thalassiosira pseudonana CCMP1335]EED95479.1 predicted protein [Thalassiosira pseudonana CCMP1335]
MTISSLQKLTLFMALPSVAGFASHRPSKTSLSSPIHHLHAATPSALSSLTATLNNGEEDDSTQYEQSTFAVNVNRRQAISQTAAAIVTSASLLANPNPSFADIEGVVSVPQSTTPPESKASNLDGKSVTVFKTKSGLQYIDLVEGTGASPKYGNFITISYKAFIKLPDIQGKKSEFDEFDSDKGFLVKHGNGRNVPGLDEGLHTMKVGGKRRIIVPPKLGYVSSGLGPIPVGPYGRWKLNRLLDRMVEAKGGNVVFDVEMKSILEDEADQGYYDDDSLSPDDFNTLRQNIESSQQASRGST